MNKQIIITIGREFGSGGHLIAEKLAEKLNLPLYDKKMISEVAKASGMDARVFEKYDEKPVNVLFSRTVNGHSNSMEDTIAEKQFDFLRKKAEAGESFIVVGRCAETIFKNNANAFHIFILADKEYKVKRISEIYNISESEAIAKMYRHDKKRKVYHNRYSKGKWGDSRNYDLCVRSNALGVEKTVESLLDIIQKKFS
ncbi:MAG: cytidylate kinase-like family protein [Lachnospiraceae bacterium]|nr:cytidylate kinase-like family protein [Lachnospiraceae bacterium]